MKTVNEVSKLTGVSVRTLHHYDSIGLLEPEEVTESGYRLYGEKSLCRLRSILIFRELEFPLKDIKEILDSPNYDTSEAIDRQIELLEMKVARLNKIIQLAEKLRKGEDIMDKFDAFDNSEMENYKKEAKERWDSTDAYKEYEQKAKGKNKDYFNRAGTELMDKLSEIGNLRELDADSDEVKAAVKSLQDFITQHFYTCTNEILLSLGIMYTEDDRFKTNIDKTCGAGTADFVRGAIEEYCKL